MKVFFSMRTHEHSDYKETQSALSDDWLQWTQQHDLIPILIPNGWCSKDHLDSLEASALVLTGGGNPCLEDTRSQTETFLIEYALEKKLPILGVCRGFQRLNLYFGGTLRTIENKEHVACKHSLSLSQDLPKLPPQRVNSFHNLGVQAQDLAQDLEILATDKHHWVEAIKHTTLPIWAIQWHPERENEDGVKLDHYFIEQWRQACA